jgi:hypothetical protein
MLDITFEHVEEALASYLTRFYAARNLSVTIHGVYDEGLTIEVEGIPNKKEGSQLELPLGKVA